MATKKGAESTPNADDSDLVYLAGRMFAWGCIAIMAVYLANNYLTFWLGWPGVSALFQGSADTALSAIQGGLYLLAMFGVAALVLRTRERALRPDSEIIFSITAYIIRASFWAVLFVGVADMVVSFMRVEGLLPAVFGDEMAISLGKSAFRGVWVHFPMLALGLVFGALNRDLGFPWLALLVVGAELLIVLTRFIFSYEQAFMADLVRFWYAALFLFSSAYTLLEEGHVRVDVLYSGFDDRTKGLVNAFGSVFLGISLCAVVLYFGMNGKSTVINGPLLIFETTQTGFGMYVKYWMAGFLAIFAVSMLIQFSGYFLEGLADFFDEPGKRKIDNEGILE